LDERCIKRNEAKEEIAKLNRLYKASEEEAERARRGMFEPIFDTNEVEFVPLSSTSDVRQDAPKLRNWSGVAQHGYSSLSGEWVPLSSSLANGADAKEAPVWRARGSANEDDSSRRRPKDKGVKLFSTGASRQNR
jgi:hypothetical protein